MRRAGSVGFALAGVAGVAHNAVDVWQACLPLLRTVIEGDLLRASHRFFSVNGDPSCSGSSCFRHKRPQHNSPSRRKTKSKNVSVTKESCAIIFPVSFVRCNFMFLLT